MEQNEITNKVADSGLINFDLEDLYQHGPRVTFDLADFLFEGLVLREKGYRQHLRELDLSRYQNAFVNIQCTADAIVPQWSFMLAAAHLQSVAKRVVMGTPETLETVLYQEALAGLDLELYRDQRVIVKGCSKYPVPLSAFVELTSKLRPVARSVMYGEACSTVPIFKR